MCKDSRHWKRDHWHLEVSEGALLLDSTLTKSTLVLSPQSRPLGFSAILSEL